jgi:hypothetical protein
MAFDYGTLTGPKSTQGSIRSWINYELIDVEGALLDAQAYIYGSLRTREMRSVASVALAEGAKTAPLPPGFLEPIKMTFADGQPLTPMDEAELMVLQGNTDPYAPTYFGIWDEALQFDTASPEDVSLRLLFNRRLPYLGRQNQTNFLTTRYPNLIRSACLMFAADAIQDDAQYARWKQRTDEQISRANVEADLSMRGRDPSASVR